MRAVYFAPANARPVRPWLCTETSRRERGCYHGLLIQNFQRTFVRSTETNFLDVRALNGQVKSDSKIHDLGNHRCDDETEKSNSDADDRWKSMRRPVCIKSRPVVNRRKTTEGKESQRDDEDECSRGPITKLTNLRHRWKRGQRKRDDRGSVETNRLLTRPTAKNILIGLGCNHRSAATDAPNANFIARRQHRLYAIDASVYDLHGNVIDAPACQIFPTLLPVECSASSRSLLFSSLVSIGGVEVKLEER